MNRIFALFFLILFSSNLFAERPTTKLGFIAILSGEYSDVGHATVNAAKLAVEDYLQAHPKEAVKLIVEDDEADPKKGLSAFQKLRTVDKADLIIPTSTFTVGLVRDIVNREKRLTFTLGNEPYEPVDDYIYMLSPASIPANLEFGKYIAKQNPKGKILVVSSENQAIVRFGEAVKEGAGPRAEILQLPAELTEYRSIALLIQQKNPAALVFVAFPKESAMVLKALRELQFVTPLYFDESIVNSLTDVRTILGDLKYLETAELLKLASNMDPEFVSRYTLAYGEKPKMWADYGYDAVMLALLLKDKPVEEARDWLAHQAHQGVSGKIEFDEYGLRKPEFSIVPLREHL